MLPLFLRRFDVIDFRRYARDATRCCLLCHAGQLLSRFCQARYSADAADKIALRLSMMLMPSLLPTKIPRHIITPPLITRVDKRALYAAAFRRLLPYVDARMPRDAAYRRAPHFHDFHAIFHATRDCRCRVAFAFR